MPSSKKEDCSESVTSKLTHQQTTTTPQPSFTSGTPKLNNLLDPLIPSSVLGSTSGPENKDSENDGNGKKHSDDVDGQHIAIEDLRKYTAALPKLDETYVNSEWDKYLFSDSPSVKELGKGVTKSASAEVVYLTEKEMAFFPDSKIESRLFDTTKPEGARLPMTHGQIQSSRLSLSSMHKGSGEMDDCEKGTNVEQSSAAVKKRRLNCLCCSRSFIVITCFVLLVCVSIVLAFIWPRLPLMQIEGSSVSRSPYVSFNPSATNYEASWTLDVSTDNSNNYVPITAVIMDTFVRHSLTGTVLGRGQVQNMVFRPTSRYNMPLPIDIGYQSKPDDPLMKQLISACGPGTKGNTTQSLELDFGITIHIWGLSYFGYKPTVTLTPPAGGFVCPFSVVQ